MHIDGTDRTVLGAICVTLRERVDLAGNGHTFLIPSIHDVQEVSTNEAVPDVGIWDPIPDDVRMDIDFADNQGGVLKRVPIGSFRRSCYGTPKGLPVGALGGDLYPLSSVLDLSDHGTLHLYFGAQVQC